MPSLCLGISHILRILSKVDLALPSNSFCTYSLLLVYEYVCVVCVCTRVCVRVCVCACVRMCV